MTIYCDNKILIFTAPSGAGKTTIVNHLLTKYNELEFSISATTRAKRSHEINGKHYHFLTHKEFKDKIHNNEFLEWEEVYDNQYYGTLKSQVYSSWDKGKCAVFDIDVKGAVRIKSEYPDSALVVFIKPPSVEILIERLQLRQTENKNSLSKRINRVRQELTYENVFDTVLINDLLEVCLKEAEFITENFLFGKLLSNEEQ